MHETDEMQFHCERNSYNNNESSAHSFLSLSPHQTQELLCSEVAMWIVKNPSRLKMRTKERHCELYGNKAPNNQPSGGKFSTIMRRFHVELEPSQPFGCREFSNIQKVPWCFLHIYQAVIGSS